MTDQDGSSGEVGGTDPAEDAYRGQSLGLPESGSGSMASTGRRVVALFIDWFAALLISRALVGEPTSTLETFATLGIFALEVTVLTWLWGASFGQRIMGIRVLGRTHRLGLVAAALRTLLICLVLPALVWDAQGRGLHDRAVDSLVLRA
ncbi:MAG: RDD family protein [Candidatus Nanopelagicales bacterium]